MALYLGLGSENILELHRRSSNNSEISNTMLMLVLVLNRKMKIFFYGLKNTEALNVSEETYINNYLVTFFILLYH